MLDLGPIDSPLNQLLALIQSPQQKKMPLFFCSLDRDVVLAGELRLFLVHSRADDFELFRRRWQQKVERAFVFVHAWVERLVDSGCDVKAEAIDAACKAD